MTFKVKLLGTLKMFIGWEFSHTEHGLYVGQEKYVRSIQRENDLTHVEDVSTPLPIRSDITETHIGDKRLTQVEHKRYC